MALNKEDISKVGYRARIDWYKERIFDISEEKVDLSSYLESTKDDFEAQDHSPDELIEILGDVQKKASKLEDKIRFLSAALSIPVNAESQPELAQAIASLDSTSKGEYISYNLYDELLKQQENAYNSVNLDYVVNNTTGDPYSDSTIIHDKIFDAFSQSVGKTASDNSLERYANRLLNNAISWNEHEYKVRQIINFADNYLDINPDPAYIPWSFRREVGEGRVDAKNFQDLWKYFSENYTNKVSDLVTGVKGLAALKLDQSNSADKSLMGITTRYLTYTNTFLNKANEVFDIEWAIDLVCCFMQWGIKLDLKTLKAIRAILQLLQTGLAFDFIEILNGLKDIINNIFRGLLCNQLVGIIKQILNRLVDPIKKWINDPQDDVWKKVFACTPIDELINNFIVKAIDYLEKLLVNLIHNWYKKIELQNIKNSAKLELKYNQKWIGELAKLLDTIIAVIEKAAQCGLSSSPDVEGIRQFMSNYNIENKAKYEFPPEEKPTKWNSFIPETPKDSIKEDAAPKNTIQFDKGAVGGRISTSLSLSECLKKIPADKVSGVKDWTGTATNNSL